uniref:14-3-3 domain-containing protein n=1 Tax=Globodera rostochiensis TaxID=31243 RepID=A0A914HE10_GLORO
MASNNRDELVDNAKLAEKAKRYNDMAQLIKKVIESGNVLINEERNLFAVAYKNVVGALRSSCRAIASVEQYMEDSEVQEEDSEVQEMQVAMEYREKIESELRDMCQDVLDLLDKYLIPKAEDPESQVFYLKMKGDYYRYLAEVANKRATVDASQQSYQAAFDIAKTKMAPTHPTRLGLALNFSVFYFEILNSFAKACELAKQAFDNATAGLDTLDEESHKDSMLIIQLLRDNLALWSSYTAGENSGEADADKVVGV